MGGLVLKTGIQTRLKVLESRLKAKREQSEPSWEAPLYTQVMRLRCQRAVGLAKGKAVLDLCCGTGWCSYELSKVAKVVGIDRDPVCIEYAKLKYGNLHIDFLVMDALELNLQASAYDLVVMCEVLEHFSTKDASKLISEVKRVLKTDGVLYGTTPIPPPEKIPALLASNRSHRHLYERGELTDFLTNYFEKVRLDKVMREGSSFGCEYFMCREPK